MRVKFGIPNLAPSLQILGKIQTGVFLISGFSVNPLLNKIIITPEPVSDDIDMKLGAVTKLEKGNKKT